MGERRVKTKHLKKDNLTKLYWENPEDFADLFNAICFAGEEVLKPGELSAQDSNLPLLETGEGEAVSDGQSRDLLKLADHVWSEGAHLLLLGLENQTEVHYAMPLRIMGYEYRNYRRQYEEQARCYQEEGYRGMSPAEMLSRMRKEDRFIPVVTVVLYYGAKPWDGARCLHDILQIPEEMRAYVADYPMHLVEVREGGLSLRSKHNRDFFELARIMLDSTYSPKERREEAVRYESENNVDLLVALTARRMFAGDGIVAKERKEGKVMLEVFEDIREEGLQEGLQKGLQKGRRAGEAGILINMYRNGFTAEQLAFASGKDIEEVRAMLTQGEAVPE